MWPVDEVERSSWVLHSRRHMFCNIWASFGDQKNSVLRNSSRDSQLCDSAKPFYYGNPGSIDQFAEKLVHLCENGRLNSSVSRSAGAQRLRVSPTCRSRSGSQPTLRYFGIRKLADQPFDRLIASEVKPTLSDRMVLIWAAPQNSFDQRDPLEAACMVYHAPKHCLSIWLILSNRIFLADSNHFMA